MTGDSMYSPLPIRLDYGCATHTGVARTSNEDCAQVVVLSDAPMGKCVLAVVADGMGGHEGGEVASSLCVASVVEFMQAVSNQLMSWGMVRQGLRGALELAQSRIRDCASLDNSNPGTTATVAVYCNGEVDVAHIGDSRAYILGSGIRQITDDDSWVAEQLRQGLITEQEATNSSNRNVLTQALSASSNVNIHFYHEELGTESCLLLCSDGLHEVVALPRIRQIMRRSSTPVEAAENLIDAANENGGPDNITAVCLWTDGGPRMRPSTRPLRAVRGRRSRLMSLRLATLCIAAVSLISLMGGLALHFLSAGNQAAVLPNSAEGVSEAWRPEVDLSISGRRVNVEYDRGTSCQVSVNGSPVTLNNDGVYESHTKDLAERAVKITVRAVRGHRDRVDITSNGVLVEGKINGEPFSLTYRHEPKTQTPPLREIRLRSIEGSPVSVVLQPLSRKVRTSSPMPESKPAGKQQPGGVVNGVLHPESVLVESGEVVKPGDKKKPTSDPTAGEKGKQGPGTQAVSSPSSAPVSGTEMDQQNQKEPTTGEQ